MSRCNFNTFFRMRNSKSWGDITLIHRLLHTSSAWWRIVFSCSRTISSITLAVSSNGFGQSPKPNIISRISTWNKELVKSERCHAKKSFWQEPGDWETEFQMQQIVGKVHEKWILKTHREYLGVWNNFNQNTKK